jgi:hypothetical protein
MNIAIGTWVMPYGPDDEKTISPGLDLASLTKSLTDFAGSEG